jgi:hypothetical protein
MSAKIHQIKFVASGRGKAQCAPNPDFPEGISFDLAGPLTSCDVHLPYPAPECGHFEVLCDLCGYSIALTAAGPRGRSALSACSVQSRENEAGLILKGISTGLTWCFTHGCPIPCEICDLTRKRHPFLGRCFDCKKEYADDAESGEKCSCGSVVRARGVYRYPQPPWQK